MSNLLTLRLNLVVKMARTLHQRIQRI